MKRADDVIDQAKRRGLVSLSTGLLAAGGLVALVGCGEGDRTVRGATPPGIGGSAGAGGAAGNAGSSGASGSAGKAGGAGAYTGPKVREVFQRNRFGDTNPENTLWDGDFEWAGPFVSQYPWLSIGFGGGSFEAPGVKVSGQCFSGLKCGTLTSTRSAAGIAVSPTTPMTRVQVFAKPPADEDCSVISVQYTTCFEGGQESEIPALTEKPEAKNRGYCELRADVPTLGPTPCLFLAYEGEGEEALFDAAFVGAPPAGTAPLAAFVPKPVSARAIARLAHAQEVLRAYRDRPPPPPKTPPVTLPTRRLPIVR